MAKINVDFQNTCGKIKPMHAVGQPPLSTDSFAVDFSYFRYLQEANMPYARLHDVGGRYGDNRYVDIPNIFRNFDADETDPANYDFTFTDALLSAMADYGIKPIFRLGVTIENEFRTKAYYIYPPKDFAKWARICEHIIRHYNEGWADGYHYNIEYWEIWNEPDNGPAGENQMWLGTNEEFYRLYDITAKHLKGCFGDTIKVGGYGASSPRGIFYEPEKYGVICNEKKIPKAVGIHRVEFFFGFMDYITAHGSPMDFFSWHSYADTFKTMQMAYFFDRELKKYGFGHIETMLNEWNEDHNAIELATARSAACSTATMCSFQSHCPTDILCFYDARLTGGRYGGFFDCNTHQPTPLYYAFLAYGKLYAMGTQVLCESDTEEVYALAATDGVKKGILITNLSKGQPLTTNLTEGKVYLIDDTHKLFPTDRKASGFYMKQYETIYIEV